MPENREISTTPRSFTPLRIFALLVAFIFIVEMAEMLLLPVVLPPGAPYWVTALLDSAVLAMACATFLWSFVLRSLRETLSRETRRAQAELRLANEQLEGIFASTHILTAYLDNRFNFVRVNRAYAEADGRPADFFPGQNHFALYPNAENETIFREVLKSGQPYTTYAKPFEYPDHPERGVTYWDWNLQPVKDRQGAVAGLLLTLINVTERKHLELARETSERNANALLNATTESIILLDTHAKIMAINQTAAQRFKSTPDALMGQNIFQFMPAGLATQREQAMLRVLQEGKAEFLEDEREGIHFETWVHPVFDGRGKIAGAAIYATDVTERKLLQFIEALLLEVNQQVLRGVPLADVLNFVCAETSRLFKLELVWVGRKEASGAVSIAACAGAASGYREELRQVGVRWDNTPQGNGPTGSAIKSGQTQIFRSSDPRFAPWLAAARHFGLESVMAIPLIIRGRIFGAFTLYSHDPAAFDSSGIAHRLTNIATRVSVMLEMAMDQEQLRLIGAALEATSNAMFITDHAGNIQWLNDAFSRLSGYTTEEILGQNIRVIKSGHQDADYYQRLWNTILGGTPWQGETTERHKDGHLYTVLQTITPIFDDEGKISHFIAVHEDITARKKAEARIQHMAQHDSLTGLPNRALFYDRLQQMLAIAKRGHRQLALLYLDLDGFKEVNDQFGHHVGDLLLKAVTRRLRKSVRESDTIARLGGDEFTVILADTSDTNDSVTVAEKIIASIARPFQLEGHEVRIGTSIGIAHYQGGGMVADRLVKLADSAMYEAKKQGKNTYRRAAE